MSSNTSNADDLYQAAYDHLRSRASYYLRHDDDAANIQPTELVNEAVVNLYGKVSFRDRAHLIATITRAMRRVLVNAARERATVRRGGNAVRITLHDESYGIQDQTVDVVEIDAALSALATQSERVAKVAELVVFSGLTQTEIAEHLEVAERTIGADWAMARAWLTRELELRPLRGGQPEPDEPEPPKRKP